jgi:hypothetical protein
LAQEERIREFGSNLEFESMQYSPSLGRVNVTLLLFKVERRGHDIGCSSYIEKSLKCLYFLDKLILTPETPSKDPDSLQTQDYFKDKVDGSYMVIISD